MTRKTFNEFYYCITAYNQYWFELANIGFMFLKIRAESIGGFVVIQVILGDIHPIAMNIMKSIEKRK